MVHRLMLKRVLSLSLPLSSSSSSSLSSSVLPAARQISTTSRKSTGILSSSLSSSSGFCVKSRANNSNNSINIGVRRRVFSTATITTTVNAISTATATATATVTNNNNNINNNSNNTKMPGPPYQYHRRQNNQHGGTSSSRPDVVVLDLFDLNQTLLNSHQKRNETFDKSRKIQLALVQVRSDIEESGGGGGGGEVQGRAAHDQDIVESIIKIQDSLVEAIETSTTTTTSTTTKEEGDGTTTTNTRSASRVPRDANLNQRVEELCRIMAYHHFLTAPTPISAPTSTDSSTGDTGIHLLLPPSKLLLCHKQQLVVKNNITITDEEYLAGACMGLCQDLSHYAMGRATARDIESVQQARDVVSSILDYLLTFDFRNGFLRRKYDGTKYQLKSLETLLYELSVTGCTATSTTSTSTVSSASSTATATDTTAAINSVSTSTYAVDVDVEEELTALHHRMEHRDQLRETLIKKCRDGQKMAKQAIYALHRKDYSKAQGLITNCETWIVQELTPIVKEEPPLRYGSYAAVIEEYVEAKLFYVWLVGKETNEENNNNNNNMDMDIEPSSVSVSSSVQQAGGGAGGATGQLLLPHEFCSQIHLEPVEYLGGLCDLTGEIGRYAVQRGTARDYDGVGLCLESNSVILNAIVLLERAPPSINKKMEQLRKSVTKIKRMTYEMSLSQAAGMNMTTSATTETEDNNKNNNDTE